MGMGRGWFVATICVLLVTPALARSTSPATRSMLKELDTIHARFRQAIQQNDRETLRRLYRETRTSDYTVKLVSGKIRTGEEQIAALDKGQMAEARFLDVERKILKLTVTGRQAVVLSESRVTMEMTDEHGTPHEVVNIMTSRDTWIKTAQGWKTKASVMLKGKTLVDGHSVER
jgi:hypothetical protein